jgi:hypothetical protein
VSPEPSSPYYDEDFAQYIAPAAPTLPVTTKTNMTVFSTAAGDCSYVTHPADEPPPFDISQMQALGTTIGGHQVLRVPAREPGGESVRRPDTLCLPWKLLEGPPILTSCSKPPSPVAEEELEHLESEDPASSREIQQPIPTHLTNCDLTVLERVQYEARQCHLEASLDAMAPKLVFTNLLTMDPGLNAYRNRDEHVPGDLSDNESSSSSDVSNHEEAVPPLDPHTRSRVDDLRVPTLGNRGPAIARSNYSSSPSIAITESTADIPVYDTRIQYREPISFSVCERIAEAERIITAAVQNIALGRTSHSYPPSPPIFHLEPGSGSVCDSPNGSADESSSSDSDSDSLDGCVLISTKDCMHAMGQMHHRPTSPDITNHTRGLYYTAILDWNREREAHQETIRDFENQDMLRPLIKARIIIQQYLEGVIDWVAMGDEPESDPYDPTEASWQPIDVAALKVSARQDNRP